MYENIHFQLKNKTKSTKWTRTEVSIKNFDNIYMVELACMFFHEHSRNHHFYFCFNLSLNTPFRFRYHTSSYLQSSSRYWLLKWCHAWVIIEGAANQCWFKGQPRWPQGSASGNELKYIMLNHTEVELQDFKVDHNKFLMLLRLSEYKNKQISNGYNFSYACPIFKKFSSFWSGEKLL